MRLQENHGLQNSPWGGEVNHIWPLAYPNMFLCEPTSHCLQNVSLFLQRIFLTDVVESKSNSLDPDEMPVITQCLI